MDLNTILQAIVAAVVGGIVLIFTNWITARLTTKSENKKASQVLFEQFYVTEGLNPLITYLTNLELYLLNYNITKPHISPTSIELVPSEAIARTQGLLRDNGIIMFLKKFNLCLAQSGNSQTSVDLATIVREIVMTLEQLRVDVLTSTDLVKTKGIVPDAFHASTKIKEAGKQLDDKMSTTASN